jgi:uncharacterized membrane protein YhaH (DUF805 family)
MRTAFTIWIIGYAIAAALLFVSSKKLSEDIGERLFGSLILGLLSWIYVLIVVVYHLLKPKGGQ